ncbi:GNAT family N-acetyltransferase [Phenylobacterium sp.]|uniref:GNAT family N-acetyltransferase n=1 Tax=Phenylobacterium sp. TaxID=1871053 RepID=UPI0030F494AC
MTDAQIEALRRGAESPVAAGPADIDAVADDLNEAFRTDPQFCWFLRNDNRREAARLRFMKMLLKEIALPTGEVTRPAGGGAVSIWIPSEALGPNSLLQELRVFPAILGATGFGRIGRLAAMRKIMDELHPMERPHAYLWFLGVRPEAQGLGLGSRMLKAGLAKVDAASLPAYLESSNEANVPLYRRYGFEVMREFRARPDAPPAWAMWREPQAV